MHYASDEGSREDGRKSLMRTVVGGCCCESEEKASGELESAETGVSPVAV